MPTMVQAGTYSSTLQYLKAIQAAGTDDPDAVMKQLKEMTLNDATVKGGKIRADGRMVHEFYLYQVKTPSESKGPWDLLQAGQHVSPGPGVSAAVAVALPDDQEVKEERRDAIELSCRCSLNPS